MHPLGKSAPHPLEGLYQARDALSQANHDILAGGVSPADQPAYGQAVTGVQTALAQLERTLDVAGVTDHHRQPPPTP
jgi:hypothetical protein